MFNTPTTLVQVDEPPPAPRIRRSHPVEHGTDTPPRRLNFDDDDEDELRVMEDFLAKMSVKGTDDATLEMKSRLTERHREQLRMYFKCLMVFTNFYEDVEGEMQKLVDDLQMKNIFPRKGTTVNRLLVGLEQVDASSVRMKWLAKLLVPCETISADVLQKISQTPKELLKEEEEE